MPGKQPKPPRPNVAKSPANSRSGRGSIAILSLTEEALKYRMMGYSFSKIAATMDLPMGTVAKYIYKALKQSRERGEKLADELITMELQRLDLLIEATLPKAIDGDLKAVDAVLKVLDRRYDLLGIGSKESIKETETSSVTVIERVIVHEQIPKVEPKVIEHIREIDIEDGTEKD